jgi:hypothetical protein
VRAATVRATAATSSCAEVDVSKLRDVAGPLGAVQAAAGDDASTFHRVGESTIWCGGSARTAERGVSILKIGTSLLDAPLVVTALTPAGWVTGSGLLRGQLSLERTTRVDDTDREPAELIRNFTLGDERLAHDVDIDAGLAI